MIVAPLASALPARAGAPTGPNTLTPNEADVFTSTVDTKGRLALRGPALTMGWTTGQELWLSRREGGLLLSRLPHSDCFHAIAVVLDSRCRLVLPYFIRVQNNWPSGIRLMVLAVPGEGMMAALPVARLAAALLGNP